MAPFKSLLVVLSSLTISSHGFASEFRPIAGDLPPLSEQGKQEFVALIDHVVSKLQDVAQSHGARITTVINWDSSGYGAFTLRKNQGRIWEIQFYDALARLPFATDDMVTTIVCHEIGHHIGGYPFKDNGWSAAEGQADYFANHACLPKVWEDEAEKNRSFRNTASPILRKKCDTVFESEARRDICYRSAVNMQTLVQYEGYGLKKPPRIDSPDTTRVKETYLDHPKAQCRIDTALAGMLCNIEFDLSYVPGHFGKGENTLDAEADSNRFICTRNDGEVKAARPACWFATLGR